MKINIDKGKYVVAVSGGVDSMVLLDLLRKQDDIHIVVAHFNHGIRTDSSKDEELVKSVAAKYSIPIKIGYGNLDKTTSEEAARVARYSFLESIRAEDSADAIITAHHQDDYIETAFINILRGTGPAGLSAIANNSKIKRPLLKFPKIELKEYAKKNRLIWNEDSTNNDTTYLRNYLRSEVTPLLKTNQRADLINGLENAAKTNTKIKELISAISKSVVKDAKISRLEFSLLPNEIGSQLVVFWLNELGAKNYDKKIVNSISIALKTAQPGTKHNIGGQRWLILNNKTAYFTTEA